MRFVALNWWYCPFNKLSEKDSLYLPGLATENVLSTYAMIGGETLGLEVSFFPVKERRKYEKDHFTWYLALINSAHPVTDYYENKAMSVVPFNESKFGLFFWFFKFWSRLHKIAENVHVLWFVLPAKLYLISSLDIFFVQWNLDS